MKEEDKYVTYFKCAENVDDIPAQQAASIEYFGDVNKDLEMERGLTKVVQTHGELTLAQKSNYYTWAKKADYNASLLCYTQGGTAFQQVNAHSCGIMLLGQMVILDILPRMVCQLRVESV